MAKNTTAAVPTTLILMRLMFKVLGPLLPGIMGRYAYNLWLTPLRVKSPAIEKVYAQKAKASFIIVDDLKIRVWSWGEGPTVLFIHGWGGRGTQISGYIDDLIQSGFNVMSFDMPAHGESEGKHTNAISIAKITNEVIRKIDNLHTIITHSFGGIIFSVIYHSNLRLKNIVMICPPADLDTAFDQFCETLQLSQSIQNFIVSKLKVDFGNDIFERLSLINMGANITQPVLVVHDQQDIVVPYQDGKDVANTLKHGTFYGTTQLGHRKVLYDKTVIEYVLKYISRID